MSGADALMEALRAQGRMAADTSAAVTNRRLKLPEQNAGGRRELLTTHRGRSILTSFSAINRACTVLSHTSYFVGFYRSSACVRRDLTMAEAEGAKRLMGLLNGIAQSSYYGNADITEELLKSELYPDLPADQFRALLEKMRGLLKSIVSADMDINLIDAFLTAQAKKQGGITTEQAAVIDKFWKNHKRKIREHVVSQSRWENNLKSMNWRIDLKSQSRHKDQENSPVAIVEMEIGKNDKESEFLYLEFNEGKINRMLKQLAEVEDCISALTQSS